MPEPSSLHLVRIVLIWVSPARHVLGGPSFIVEYEGFAGPGCALLSGEELDELNILSAYMINQRVPPPLGGQRLAP